MFGKTKISFGEKVENEIWTDLDSTPGSDYYKPDSMPSKLTDYYAKWKKQQPQRKTDKSVGELLAETSLYHSRAETQEEKSFIDEQMKAWSSNLKGEIYYQVTEPSAYYARVRGDEHDLSENGIDALAIPNSVLDSWATTGRTVTFSGAPAKSELEFAERLYGREVGEKMVGINSSAMAKLHRHAKSNFGENFLIKIWVSVAIGSFICKWFYVRTREYMRQRTKLAYILSDPSVHTENNLLMAERHKEWLQTYYEEDEEDEDEEEEDEE